MSTERLLFQARILWCKYKLRSLGINVSDWYLQTTEDFCGDKKVDHKVCSKNNGNARIVGYYEGWAPNRPCNVFWPEDIPIGLYTHINFAFATIDPKTFKVAPSSKTDVDLYKRLMLHKQKDPGLKVFIAIGGWTFNDPGPTATTFSDLAASVPRQKTFIDSLLSFMSTYGFDGLDLDWWAVPDTSAAYVS
jgi:GH18 family chitinase